MPLRGVIASFSRSVPSVTSDDTYLDLRANDTRNITTKQTTLLVAAGV